MLRYNPYMKHLYLTITTTTLILLLTSCGNSTSVAPSQNDALNTISNSNGKEKSGYMQKGLDSWLVNDWKPKVEQNKEIQSKYMQKSKTQEGTQEEYVEKQNKPFTLQEYVDKTSAYFEAQERDLENSNIEKMKKMPVIGK